MRLRFPIAAPLVEQDPTIIKHTMFTNFINYTPAVRPGRVE